MENASVIALLAIASGICSLLCLLALHFVSPEFKPSWRMVSEYALGKHKRILTYFFWGWGFSSVLTSIMLLHDCNTIWGKIGLLFLFISGVGAIMGGFFDVQHKYHGLSFSLGVPTLIVGSLLIAYNLTGKGDWQEYTAGILSVTRSVWISCVLMGILIGIMFSGFKKAGIAWDKDSTPPEEVPDGVIALGGYGNRLLVVCYIGWNLFIAFIYLKINQ